MEEILASIRRIIEDSDSTRKPQVEPMLRPVNDVATPAARAEVETFRAELGPAVEPALGRRPVPAATTAGSPVRSTEPARGAEPDPKAFRLAEVQAQVARETTAPPKAPDTGRKPATLADVQREIARQPAATAEPAAAASTPVLQQPKPAAARPAAATAPLQPKIEQPAEPTVRKTAEPAVFERRPAENSPAAAAPVVPEASTRPPIISEAAGRQVAAAFGQLSEAFAQRANKTFEDMAEQMLRPMLQEWLDNNLPLLVERLVREEIERIARGG
jgi:cell pole-organizing protein PopZ